MDIVRYEGRNAYAIFLVFADDEGLRGGNVGAIEVDPKHAVKAPGTRESTFFQIEGRQFAVAQSHAVRLRPADADRTFFFFLIFGTAGSKGTGENAEKQACEEAR